MNHGSDRGNGGGAMKKYLLLVFCFACLVCKGQNHHLIDTNKVWNIYSEVNFGPAGNTICRIGGDTTIGAYQYKKLVYTPDSGAYLTFGVNAAREDTLTKRVYFYSNTEYLAYDFSIAAGDTFRTAMGGCPVEMPVVSVDTVTLLNGELRRRINFGGESWTDGIGSTRGLPYAWIDVCIFDILNILACFAENDTLKYRNATLSSCNFLHTGIKEQATIHEAFVLANPFSKELVIRSNASAQFPTTITLFSYTGKEILRIKANSEETVLNTEGIAAGLYLLRVEGEGGVGNYKVVKAE